MSYDRDLRITAHLIFGLLGFDLGAVIVIGVKMTYDRDLRIAARVMVGLLALNLAAAIALAFFRQWWSCAIALLWAVNSKGSYTMNRNMQYQRDRNRLIEAAVIADWERRRP